MGMAATQPVVQKTSVQRIFQRQEKKYLLNRAQFDAIHDRLLSFMEPDRFGQSTVSSVYYDNDWHELIIKSIEKPIYKEKFRLRSYGVPNPDSPVFAEIKKKYNGVVYKRRVTAPYEEMNAFLAREKMLEKDVQIQKEILYMIDRYQLHPALWLSYDRLALSGRDDPQVRVTFDLHTRFRTYDLDLASGDYGEPLRDDNFIIMETKVPGAAPLWLARLLSEMKIYPGSFSKYGTCYQEKIMT